MTISEDTIMKHLDFHLSQSEPGAMLHHMSVLQAPANAVNALGMVDESKVHTSMYALVPDTSAVNEMIAGATYRARSEAVKANEDILLAVVSQEMWHVPDMSDPHALELHAQGRLDKHPEAVEVTIIYAACRDGRRWRGRRYLTGPKAGQTEDVELLVGQPRRGESRGVAVEAYIRAMVTPHG